MKRSLKWLLILIFVPAFLFLSIYILDKNRVFAVRQINIEVVTIESQKKYPQPYVERIQQRLNEFVGQSLWTVSLNEISKILKQEKWIQQFHISRQWPVEINLTLQPYELSYLIIQPKGNSEDIFIPVTSKADLLPAIDSTQTPSLAILKGADFSSDVNKRKKAIELLEALPRKGKVNSQKLSEVSYDRKEGYWIRLIDSETQIKLGENDFGIKSARVAEVLQYLEKKDLKARVIDANLSKKVLVRLH